MTLTEPTFLILTTLAERPRHGYGMIKEVASLSEGKVKLGAGTLYGTLDRLCTEGYVEFDREEIERGRLRRFYKLTNQGVALLRAEVERRAVAVDVARRRLAAWRPPKGTAEGV
jgi:PadR family transcriptional regulator, regulatory protein PadR